jgi:hypothetical protein
VRIGERTRKVLRYSWARVATSIAVGGGGKSVKSVCVCVRAKGEVQVTRLREQTKSEFDF